MKDFNAKISNGREGREVRTSTQAKEMQEENEQQNFAETMGQLYQTQNMRKIYTWKMHANISRYLIDCILVKNRFKKPFKICKAYPNADCDNDHNLIMVEYELRYKKSYWLKVK